MFICLKQPRFMESYFDKNMNFQGSVALSFDNKKLSIKIADYA